MTALYKAGQALGFDPEQVEALLFFWDLSQRAKYPEQLKIILKERLHLSQTLIEDFLRTLRTCTRDDCFDTQTFCHQLWDENHALEALALVLYFQQLYFTKTTIEESSTQPTEFTNLHARDIQIIAEKTFNMLRACSAKYPSDITFIIGAKAKTCQTYLQQFYSETRTHHLGQAYIFLSTRSLAKDPSDNPVNDANFIYAEADTTKNYHDYLTTYYLERYNHFMSTQFHTRGYIPITSPTEGLAMFERYEAIFKQSFESAVANKTLRPFYTGAEDALTFYQQALAFAIAQSELKTNSHVSLAGIQPYLPYLEIQFDMVRRQLVKQADPEAAEVLRSLQRTAYGPEGINSPHILAQRLAAMIDVQYMQAGLALKDELGFHNAVVIPNQHLRLNYSHKPLVFLCSSVGDANLAKATILNLSQSSRRSCAMIALSDAIAEQLSTFADTVDNVTMVTHINHRPIGDCSADDISAFARDAQFAHAFIGMPSNNEDQRAMKIACKLDIPAIFASDFMFEPPHEHAIWTYHDALCQKANLQFAVPLLGATLFSGHPRRHVTGHLSFSSLFSSTAMSMQEKIAIKTQLAVAENNRLAVVSGTTQPPGIDTEFLTEILNELRNHPSFQLRYSIHPGVQNMGNYLHSLISIAEKAGVIDQFKIILNESIKNKLAPNSLETLKQSPWILEVNVTGHEACTIADAIAQAVPGALVNTSAFQGKPTYSHGDKPLLPASWFSKTALMLFSAEPVEPHQPHELGLDKSRAVEEVITRLMLY